ncbi:MAG: carbohydrate ABC transporter permease [Clostridia bacterium]|nr:carbohydrate ABC transporter permease [Clostridia bacterium]
MKKALKLRPAQAVLHILLILFLLVNIFPVVWMISCSFKSPTELFDGTIHIIPRRITMENFHTVFTEYAIFDWIKNSLATTVGITVLTIIVSFLAAFGLCYYRTKLNSFLFYLLYLTMVIPFQVTMIPNYVVISRMSLMNTWTGVILPNVCNAAVFFFLYQSVRGVHPAYYEAAKIEGANSFWVMTRVTFGICKGALAARSILTFIESWNIYFWPMLVLTKPETRTITVGLKQFLDFEMGNRWGPFLATATIATMPVVLVYLFLQRRIIGAFTSVGIKG